MRTLLAAAGTAFLRAFAASIVILAAGVLAAPNLDQAVALGIAALIASLAAGLRAVQIFVPQISFAGIVAQPWAAWLDAFTRAFVGAFITGAIGLMAMPDLSTWRAASAAIVIGAATAGARALQGLLTAGETPVPRFGLRE